MSKNLTMAIKRDECQFCGNCNKKALQKGQAHCKSKFRPRDGHCCNFKGGK